MPVSGVIAPGTPLGVLQIPRLGLEQVFVEGSASEQTMKGPGLKLDSVLPGQQGVSILIGRRATFGAPFANLDELQTGDLIVVTTGQGRFEYVVDIVRTTDAPETEIEAVPSRLSLSPRTRRSPRPGRSSSPPSSTARRCRPRRARHRRSTTSQARAARATSSRCCSGRSSCSSSPASSPGPRTRVPGRALWIGAVPVFLAILWNVFENLAILLPNTL